MQLLCISRIVMRLVLRQLQPAVVLPFLVREIQKNRKSKQCLVEGEKGSFGLLNIILSGKLFKVVYTSVG